MDNRKPSWRRAVGGHPWPVRPTFPPSTPRPKTIFRRLSSIRLPRPTTILIFYGFLRGSLRIRFVRPRCNRVLRVRRRERAYLVVGTSRLSSVFCAKRRLRLIFTSANASVLVRGVITRDPCEEKWSFHMATVSSRTPQQNRL